MSAASAGAFAFLVLFGTMAAFWCFLAGLRHVTPVVAGLLNSVEPLAGYFFSMVLLGDVLGFWQTAGIGARPLKRGASGPAPGLIRAQALSRVFKGW